MATGTCDRHLGQAILWDCGQCSNSLCQSCAGARYGGVIYCPACRDKRELKMQASLVRRQHRKTAREKIRHVMAGAIIILGVFGIYAGVNAVARFFMNRNYVADRPMAPDFAAKDINGRIVAMSGLRGKVVVLDFWAGWCPPCIALVPDLKKLNDEFKDKEFLLLGINKDESEEAMRLAVKKHKIEWAQIFDPVLTGSSLSDLYDIEGLPATIIIDQNGRIYKRWGQGDRKMREFVAFLLEKKAGAAEL